MKKLYTLAYYKRRNRKLAKRSLEQQLRFKKKLRKKNRSYNGSGKEEREIIRDEVKYKSYSKVKAPKKLSFINNTDEVINFIQKLEKLYLKKRKVYVILTDVETIEYDAIVVLLSIMMKFRSSKIGFNGDFPKDVTSKNILIASGFFSNLYPVLANKKLKLASHHSIHTHAWTEVDSELADSLIAKASKSIWGKPRRCPGVQRSLLELMQNTHNHADTIDEGGKQWWLSINHRKSEGIVSFSFVDFGVGVFESLNGKKSGDKFYDGLNKLKSFFTYNNNSDVLKLILEGELHRTVTGKYYRGKGLPGIYEVCERNQVSKLHVITNDVFADVETKMFKNLSRSFSGTFIYWELNEGSHNLSWEYED